MSQTTDGRSPLGMFLRTRRDGIPASDPEDDAGRRTRGARRSEIADAAGISVPYLVRLEQGRNRRPSAPVVDGLARALGLDTAGRRHLRTLAGLPDAPATPPPARVRPGLRALLESWTEQGAFVLDPYTTVLAANATAVALCPVFAPGTNILYWLFDEPTARDWYPDWQEVVDGVVADARTTSTAAGEDARFRALVDELTGRDDEFRRLWARHDTRDKTVGVKRFAHPRVGELTLHFETFVVTGAPTQTLFVVHAEPGTTSATRLRKLADVDVDPADADHGVEKCRIRGFLAGGRAPTGEQDADRTQEDRCR